METTIVVLTREDAAAIAKGIINKLAEKKEKPKPWPV